MSNEFTLTRNEGSLKIFLKSPTIERFFKDLAGGTKEIDPNFRVSLWKNEEKTPKYLETLNKFFQNQVNLALQADINAVWPSFRKNNIFEGNEISVRFLSAVGIGEGKTFEVAGSFSKDTAIKIGKAYQKAIDYLVNEAFKTIIVKFVVSERDNTATPDTTILEFDNND